MNLATYPTSRRNFMKASACMIGGTLLSSFIPAQKRLLQQDVKVSAHLWVYASKYPPNWDSTPILSQVFSDLSYAGLEGVELMEVNLRHEDAVTNISRLIDKYQLPVTGTSYGADMWNKEAHPMILKDVALVTERLHQLGGTTFGISVGNAQRRKTAAELDAQAELLKEIMKICKSRQMVPNLHNHTYEVEDDLHELKGTLARVPDIKLGPDINWLIRAGVDPVAFIHEYGDKIVYLHLRDQKANGKWTEALGEGSTDFSAIAQALQEVNFDGRAAIELAFDESPKRPLKEDWKISRKYVQKIFGW